MATKPVKREAYGGKFVIEHNPNARGRAPRYKVNGAPVKGVTTIMSKVLAKPGLFLWPLEVCLAYLRTKMPLITEEDLIKASNEHNRLRNAGGDSGTIAHDMAESYLRGEVIPTTNDAGAEKAFKAFKVWFELTTPKLLGVEDIVYSEKFNYAGTYDALLEIDGRVVLSDLKTTKPSKDAPKGVYADNFIQLGMYAGALREEAQYQEVPKIDDLLIISAKKDGNLDTVYASDLGLSIDQAIEDAQIVGRLYHHLESLSNKLKGKDK